MIWKDSLKIGVEEVDRQHRELFDRLHSFLRAVRGEGQEAEKRDEIEKTLNFMGDYVDSHFTSEEGIQRQVEYPGYEEHREIHEQFKSEIRAFKEEFAKGYNEELVLEFSGRLLTWLLNHVADEDQKIADYVDENVK